MDPVPVGNMVKEITANKLFPIFVSDLQKGPELVWNKGPNLDTMKRKISPPVGIPHGKSLRERSNSCASPSLRQREDRCVTEYDQRLRDGEVLKKVGSGRKDCNNKRKGRRRYLSIGPLDPDQQTLKDLWKNLKRKASEHENSDVLGGVNDRKSVEEENKQEANNVGV